MPAKKGKSRSPVKESVEPAELKFSRDQMLAAARYHNRKDLVSVLLQEGRKYTVEEVDRLIDGFMKGKVK